jgi:cobalamin biosynthetic protein CobC
MGRAMPEPPGHGGDLTAIRRRFPDAPLPWIDLSTGINPVPYPVGEVPADSWARLPTPAALDALLAAAAQRYGVADPSSIAAAPGTQALIQLLPRLLPSSRVAVVGRTYAEHELSWHRGGHEVTVVPDLAAAAGAHVIVIVNPDNPTGRLVAPQELRAVHASLLVVDESFIDLLPPEASLARDLPRRTVVLRSFGKTYGLAGVRLGFAVASAFLALMLRTELGPWAVSGPALEIGRRALEDDGWLQAATTRLARDRDRLDALLVAAGFTVEGGTPLFRLAGHFDAQTMVDRLGRHGLHVRAFGDRPGALRFGIPAGDDAFRRLASALQVPQKVL